MNTAEILQLKFPNAKFLNDIGLRDQGNGIEIYLWNMGDIPKPTQDDLDQWAVELDLEYRQKQAVSKRSYPSIGDQLDMIYKDLKNGTQNFISTIDQIKAAHPKPTE